MATGFGRPTCLLAILLAGLIALVGLLSCYHIGSTGVSQGGPVVLGSAGESKGMDGTLIHKIMAGKRLAKKKRFSSQKEKNIIAHISEKENATLSPEMAPVEIEHFFSQRAIQHMQEKLKRPIDAVFHFHSRKAGGTTLENFMRVVVCAKLYGSYDRTQCSSVEGGVVWRLPDTLPFNGTNILKVTSLRHPVDRACSSFFFEGRWNHLKSNDREQKARNFNEWLQMAEDGAFQVLKRLSPSTPSYGGLYWLCGANCYTHWFGATDGNIRLPTRALRLKAMEKTAVAVLKDFDLVVDVIHFKIPQFWMAFAKILGITIDFKTAAGYARGVKPRKSPSPLRHCRYSVPPEDVQWLYQHNQEDIRIYNKFSAHPIPPDENGSIPLPRKPACGFYGDEPTWCQAYNLAGQAHPESGARVVLQEGSIH